MSNKKQSKSFNSVVHHFAKTGLNLSRRDNLVFYKLLGFLIRNDKPFPYSNEKLAANTLYKISAIKESLNNLEKVGLIKREGFSYQRRFSKGLALVNICAHSHYCLLLDLNDTCTHGQDMAGTSQKMAGTGQNPARIELDKTNQNLKKGTSACAHSTPKPKKPTVTDFQEYNAGIKGYEWVGDWIKKHATIVE